MVVEGLVVEGLVVEGLVVEGLVPRRGACVARMLRAAIAIELAPSACGGVGDTLNHTQTSATSPPIFRLL